MTSDIISKISEAIKNSSVNVSIRKVPSYISCFFQEERDVILIHRMISKARELQYLHDKYGGDISDDDLTGQPLEAPYLETCGESFEVTNTLRHLKNEDDNHIPLSVNEARSFLSYMQLNLKVSLPVWILTDGNDLKKTCLLSIENHGDCITRSWVSDYGFVPNLSLDELISKHVQFSNQPAHLASCVIRSSYCIKKAATIDSNVHFSSILHASWTKLTMEPPLLHRSTEIKLNTHIRIGHGHMGLLFIWRQIMLLNDYMEMLSNLATDKLCPVPVLNLPSSKSVLKCLGREADVSSLYTRIHETLKEPIKGLNSARENKKLEEIIEHYILKDKPGTDLTDRLWLLFIECSTFQELSSCIKELFIGFNKKNEPIPFLNSLNISRLGNLFLREGGIHDPLECLVEIGLEKLRKEMLLIFCKAQIAAGYNLNIPNLPKFTEVSSGDWLPYAKKWHTWLCQIYCAVEILCNVQESLSLSNIGMLAITANLLKEYTGKDSPIHSYEDIIHKPLLDVSIPIPVKNFDKHIFEKPEEWVLTLTTSTKNENFQSGFHKTSKNPFPYSNYNFDDDHDITLQDSNFSSRCFEFHSITEKF